MNALATACPRALCARAFCATLALCAAQAHAQSAAEWNVGDRARPAYDPTGARLGGFLLFPSLELGVRTDDNIYNGPDDAKQDIVQAVRPRVSLVSQWSNHEFVLDAGADLRHFMDAHKEGVTDWFASAAGRIDANRDTWLAASLGVRELHEERGDPESPRTAARPVSREMLTARLEGFRRFNRVSLEVEAETTDIAYRDAFEATTGERLVQSDRDRSENEVSLALALELAPGYEAYVRGTRFVRRYDGLQGKDGYNRDSDGTQIVVGARRDLGAVLYADVFAGRREQSYDADDRLPTAEGATFGGSVTWNVTSLTTVRATASRSVEESTLRQASGYQASTFELGADHELRRNLLLGASVRATSNRYEGISREDDILIGSIGSTWLVGRGMRVQLGYRFRQRDSTSERNDYERNSVHLDVRIDL